MVGWLVAQYGLLTFMGLTMVLLQLKETKINKVLTKEK